MPWREWRLAQRPDQCWPPLRKKYPIVSFPETKGAQQSGEGEEAVLPPETIPHAYQLSPASEGADLTS